jgi:LysM repeat protein
MASPWISPARHRQPPERPWMGMALLLSVPLLSLVLIRMLWSGSTIWFLIAGILMLGSAAVVFLARRDGPAYGYQTLSPEPNRLPTWLVGLGVLFLGMLVVPSVSSGSGSPADSLHLNNSPQQASNSQPIVTTVTRSQATPPPTARATARPTATTNPSADNSSSTPSQATPSNPPASGQTYVVKDGDTLWDIANKFGTTVSDIVAANHLPNDSELKLGQELVIPASANAATSDGGQTTASEPKATPTP